MELPFTTAQFFSVMREYNETVWPAQIVLVALAVVALIWIVFPRRWSGTGVSAILAILWAWLGVAYHLAFFTSINPLAYGFAAVSILGAVIFFWQGVFHRRLEFRLASNARTVIGVVMILFALAVYPAWSVYIGHGYPELPTFGLPCPITIFTMGLLALLVRPHPRSPLIVPILWSLIGAQAAFLLGVSQDLGLIVAVMVGLVLLMQAKHRDKNGSHVSGVE